MRLFLRLAWRNIWRHRRRTVIVVLSIGLTLSMMMMYDGMMAGFQQGIFGNAIRVLGGNIQVHATGYLNEFDQKPLLPLVDDALVVKAALAQPNVIAASRRINTGGLASNRVGAFAVEIIGIEPEQELPVSLSAQHVAAGKFLTSADKDVLFIGKGLADAMRVAVGDRIPLAGRATHDQMRTRTMTVGGIFDLGMPDIEKRSVYMSLAEAQDLYSLPGQSTEVAIMLQSMGQEPGVVSTLSRQLPGYEVTPWQTNFPDLVTTITRKDGVMDIFSVIILVIAGIGIFNMLMMAVYERTREIGILGAMGLKPRQISLLFVLEGAMLGVVGIAFGVALGMLCNAALGAVGIDFSKFSSVTEYTALITGKIYSTLGTEKLPMRAITVMIIALIAALYPAREASLSEPATALHYV